MKPFAYKQTNLKLKSVVADIENGVIDNKFDNKLPQGPIHVDIKADNELFIGDKLTGIIDFGNFYRGPLILDVGKTIIFNCIKNNNINKEMMKKFLMGYEKYRKLTKKEHDNIFKAIRYAIYSHIWLDLYHVPLKLVPQKHTLYFVKKFLPAIRKLDK
jgi:Ser/Thr protein kinase RdoA (MazF antagonist)